MGQWLPPAQASDPRPLTTRCPPVLQTFQKGVWGGRNPGSLRTRAEGGSAAARAAEGSLGGRKGRRRRKGRGRRAGQSNCMFVSAPVSAREGACVAVGVASPPGVCVCWQRCQCVCLRGSGLSLAPPRPHAVFWGARLWAHPALLRADAADVAGPQLCRLPGEGEGLQSAPPIMAAKCQAFF